MTGVFLCCCRRDKGGAAWAAAVARALPGIPVFARRKLCSEAGIRFAAARARQKNIDRVLFAGCPAVESAVYAGMFARSAGLPAGAVDSLRLPAGANVSQTVRAVRGAVMARELLPRVSSRTAPVRQDVLILGGGRAAQETARLVCAMGYAATLMEPTALLSLTGRTGDFSARLSANGGMETRAFGAVVIAPDYAPAEPASAPFVPGLIVPLSSLESRLEELRKRERPRQAAIVLDYRIDEDAAGFEAALRAAMGVQRLGVRAVVVLRDARVSSRGMEVLYAEARQAGVVFVKHDGRPEVRAGGGAVTIVLKDETLSCSLAAISETGLAPRTDREIAAAAGVSVDAYGRLQENNVHLLPTQSNRAGVFVVRGAGRAARDAAFSVHALLSARRIDVELSHAVVDGEKCALCLTCIRACPFGAMRIDETEKKADCIPESCRRCGICAAQCPARAITLPLSSDEVLLAMAGAAG